MQAILGIGFLLGLAWILSESRRTVRWRPVMVGLVVQLGLAALLLRVPVVAESLLVLNKLVYAVEAATGAGASAH